MNQVINMNPVLSITNNGRYSIGKYVNTVFTETNTKMIPINTFKIINFILERQREFKAYQKTFEENYENNQSNSIKT